MSLIFLRALAIQAAAITLLVSAGAYCNCGMASTSSLPEEVTDSDQRSPTPDAECDAIDRGRELFEHSPAVSCRDCHSLVSGDVSVGPSLGGLALRMSTEEIALSILDPNAMVATGFAEHVVLTVDGEILTGPIEFESPQEIHLRVAGELRRMALAEIEDMRPMDSTMPAGTTDGLSDADFNDLISFLGSLDGQQDTWERGRNTFAFSEEWQASPSSESTSSESTSIITAQQNHHAARR